tara:strand:- start:2812 stop:3618 length:807 start_codon:yes stop_codon:yes gene_type:complete
MKIYNNIPQNSDEWRLVRSETGITASEFKMLKLTSRSKDLEKKIKDNEERLKRLAEDKAKEYYILNSAREDLAIKDNLYEKEYAIKDERLTKEQVEKIIMNCHNVFQQSRDMERGTALEPIARDLYSKKVKQVGFIQSNDEVFGYSPDGLAGDDGLIEIKCPRFDNKKGGFLRFFLDNEAWKEYYEDYKYQIQGGLLISERKWCDFILYNDNMPNHPIINRIERDEDLIIELKIAMDIFRNHYLEKKEEYGRKLEGLDYDFLRKEIEF